MKNWPKGSWPTSRDLLFKFWDHPLISPEWLKIQTSNFACGLKIRDTKPNKMLSYRRETALQGQQGTLVLAESGRLELRDNILLIL